jgi:hypothetical protein
MAEPSYFSNQSGGYASAGAGSSTSSPWGWSSLLSGLQAVTADPKPVPTSVAPVSNTVVLGLAAVVAVVVVYLVVSR